MILIMTIETECLQKHGEKTCIFFPVNITCSANNKFEVRHLDKASMQKFITRKDFYQVIHDYLKDKYTVVIVENVNGNNTITSTHRPDGEFFSILSYF
jgi:hypothetical protein